MNAWEKLQPELAERILEYYQIEMEIRGREYSQPPHYQLDLIRVFAEGIYEERFVGLAFHCDWDEEYGFGVQLLNEQTYEIGDAGIGL